MDKEEESKRLRANLQKSYTKKKTGKPWFDKEALKVWSLIVRQRASGCEICNKEGDYDRFGRMVKNLDAHHLVGRNNYLHRYNINNGICLCKSCHIYNRNHSPHYDYNSVLGFEEKFSTMDVFSHRYEWWQAHGHEKMQPIITQEEHYHNLLDIYISMLDGESHFPQELF